MVEELFDTDIGKFKIMAHPKKSNLIFVQARLPITPDTPEGEWEELGWMKRKDFLKMIKPHNPIPIIVPSYSTGVSTGEKRTPFYENEIQNALPEIPPEIVIQSTEPATKTMKKGVIMVPILLKKLSNKKKFTVEAAKILDLCDGRHSIEDIIKITKYRRLQVHDIIREYQKKNWIEIKRTIVV